VNIAETARLCKVIAAVAPAQKFDADTPAVWAGILEDVRIEDALAAVKTLGRRERFMAPVDIITEVRTIRTLRLQAVDKATPNVDPNDEGAYRAELAAIRSAVADGSLDVEQYVAGGMCLTGRPHLAIEAGPRRDFLVPAPPEFGAQLKAANAAKREAAKDLEAAKARAEQDERTRQLAALEAMTAVSA
jgi:hypothetical protein